jgi:hypothetical protein
MRAGGHTQPQNYNKPPCNLQTSLRHGKYHTHTQRAPAVQSFMQLRAVRAPLRQPLLPTACITVTVTVTVTVSTCQLLV